MVDHGYQRSADVFSRQLYFRVVPCEHPEDLVSESLADASDAFEIEHYFAEPVEPRKQPFRF